MSRALVIKIVLCASLLFACDSSFSQSVSGVINSYYKVTGINVVPNTVTVASASGLSPGMKILIIQMKGASINQTNSSSFGNINSIGNAGNYEFNFICGIAGNNVLLQYELTRTYDPAGLVQLIPVPRYGSVTIADTVRSSPWNATTGTGGVVVLEASDTVYLNSSIDVSGQGFAGGASMSYPSPTYDCIWSTDVINYFLSVPPSPSLYYTGGWKGEGIAQYMTNGEYGRGKQANGGGGGNNHNAGGAGGANYGAGGNGGRRSNESFFSCHGTNPGVGGLSLSPFGYSVANNRIFPGGGGGSGHMNNDKGTPGASGGGIIIINANVIIGLGGRLMSNGYSPYKIGNSDPIAAEGDGAGGGGAGGTILLNVNTIAGTINAEAKGGIGSNSSHRISSPINECTGPGGGGGGGAIWIRPASIPVNLITDVSGGANGVVSMLSGIAACRGAANGATSGATGAVLANYAAPAMGNFICAPLASPILKSFEGIVSIDRNLLTWTVGETAPIAYYLLERSIDQLRYETVARVNNTSEKSMNLADINPAEGLLYYRLKLVYKDNRIEYSDILLLKRNSDKYVNWLKLHPNPAKHFAQISLYLKKPANIEWKLVNQLGQLILRQKQIASKGYQHINISTGNLSPGIYFVSLQIDGGKAEVRKLIIQ
jgi:hypothetical protein